MNDLLKKRCKGCDKDDSPLSKEKIDEYIKYLDGWDLNPDYTEIQVTYAFRNYYHTMAFVNAVAYMAHQEGHHPDLEVSYNRCVVRYTTHAIGGLTENDFICAAKADALIADDM